MTSEQEIEKRLLNILQELNYTYRKDIHDKASLEANFREHFQKLNRVNLTNSEFERLLCDIVSADVFTAAKTLRETNTLSREDGTPLQYNLVNTKNWCKNEFEVVNQLRINTSNSYHRYDVMILLNGIPVCILVLKKCKSADDNVLFINASEHFEKGKKQNYLLDEHVDKIVDTYKARKEEERFSRRVPMAEIEANNYNLNISRYVSTAHRRNWLTLSKLARPYVKSKTELPSRKLHTTNSSVNSAYHHCHNTEQLF